MKTILRVIGNIIFIAIIVVLAGIIYLNVMHSVNKTKIPSIGGVRMMTVLSGSMKPTFDPGDVIIIKESDDLKKDDIITFKRDRIIITHRIVGEVTEGEINGFKTKGDNNNVEDSFIVEKKNIIGKYLFRIPKLGYIMEFFRSKLGLIILAGVIGIVVIFEVVKSISVKKE